MLKRKLSQERNLWWYFKKQNKYIQDVIVVYIFHTLYDVRSPKRHPIVTSTTELGKKQTYYTTVIITH